MSNGTYEPFEKHSEESGSTFESTANRFFSGTKDFIDNPNKLERLLQRLEKKLQAIPAINTKKFGKIEIGEKLSLIPAQGSAIRRYCRKEYTELSKEALIAMVFGFLYFISPWDLIRDRIFLLGFVDDIVIVNFILSRVRCELNLYREWRTNNGLDIDA